MIKNPRAVDDNWHRSLLADDVYAVAIEGDNDAGETVLLALCPYREGDRRGHCTQHATAVVITQAVKAWPELENLRLQLAAADEGLRHWAHIVGYDPAQGKGLRPVRDRFIEELRILRGLADVVERMLKANDRTLFEDAVMTQLVRLRAVQRGEGQ